MNHELIAQHLLEEGFLLSALEFHTELLERGRGLESLKDFFKDSSNFETPGVRRFSTDQCPLASATSNATLDSMSLWGESFAGRYSEDSHSEADKLALVEYELRKAKEVIHSLRQEMSTKLDEESTLDSNDINENTKISKRELSTLCFLVNEFLLEQNYKLTSITFTDENDEMDLEEWDALGLCIKRPPSLIKLLRSYTSKPKLEALFSVSVQTESNGVEEKIQKLQQENLELEKQIDFLKTELEAVPTSPVPDSPPAELVQEQSAQIPLELSLIDSNLLKSFESKRQTYSSFVENDEYENENRSISEILADSLPDISPAILLTKRPALVPLFLGAIENHNDSKTRDTLLSTLFNLIKKPDKKQRADIIKGFVSMAKRYEDGSRLESELLPHCWEQLDHKHPERRTLVAETISTLMPYFPEDLRNSLVLSILKQLLLEDRDEEVKRVSVLALTSLILYMKTEDKWNDIWELFIKILQDRSIQDLVLSDLLKGLCLWRYTYFRDVATVIGKELAIFVESRSKETIYIRSLNFIIMHILASVVFSCPSHPELENSLVELIPPSSSLALMKEFMTIKTQTWAELNALKSILTSLIRASASTNYEGLSLINEIIKQITSSFNSDKLNESMLYPVFTLESNRNTPQLSLFLLIQDLNFATEFENWTRKNAVEEYFEPLENAFRLSLPDMEVKLTEEVVWPLIPSQNYKVRKVAGIYLKLLANSMINEDYFGSRVLPGIVTLVSDPNIEVKQIAILGLVSSSKIQSQSEKVLMQYVCLIEESLYCNENSNLFCLIDHFGTVLLTATSDSRDKVLFDTLPKISSFLKKSTNEEIRDKLSIKLVKFIEQILNSSKLSGSLLKKVILPTLELTEKIVNQSEEKKNTQRLIKTLSSMTKDQHQISSSPSIDDMKSKMESIFQKSPWKK